MRGIVALGYIPEIGIVGRLATEPSEILSFEKQLKMKDNMPTTQPGNDPCIGSANGECLSKTQAQNKANKQPSNPNQQPKLVQQCSAVMIALPGTPNEKHFHFNPRSASDRERARELAEVYSRNRNEQ